MSRTDVRHGRFGAEIDGDFVVFLIGPRLNQPWLALKSFGDLGEPRRGMKAMLDELMAHPEKGLLGYRMGVPRHRPVLAELRAARGVRARSR